METLKNSLSTQKVTLIRGGKDYFNLLKYLIKNAENYIYLQTYIFDEDQTGIEIADELKSAALRNVKVFVLVDGYASGNLSKLFIKSLKEAGIQFRMFDPILKSKYFYFGRRLHHKVVTIDSKYSLVGGMNISNRYNDMPNQPAWLDWAVYSEGRVSKWLTEICQSRIHPTSLKSFITPRKKISSQYRDNSVEVRINDWVHGKREITKSYLEMFSKAKSEIIIMSAYFLPNYQFRRALRRSARKGVSTKIIVAGISDISIAKYAERYMYRWLLKNKIEIYEYQKSVLHGKMAVYDQKWSTVGSYNINNVSAYASIELNLAINDEFFAKEIVETLKKIMIQDCLSITPEYLQNHSGFFKETAQWMAYYIYKTTVFLFTFYFKQHRYH